MAKSTSPAQPEAQPVVAEAQTDSQPQTTEAEAEAKAKGQPHVNFPTTADYQTAVADWATNNSLPIGKADGPMGMPSQGYAIMHLTAEAVGYTLRDSDRTPGRQKVTEAERELVKLVQIRRTRKLTAAESARFLELMA